MGDLGAAGAVVEEGSRPGVRGRPGRPVRLRGGAHVALGLELNTDYVSTVLVDLAGDVLLARARPVGTGDPLAALVALARETQGSLGPGSALVGVTVAVPALVRGDSRTVVWSPHIRATGPDVAEALDDLAPGVRVRVSNDADCAAYAEAHHGAARGVDHAICLTGTVGIGAGIVDDGDLVRGAAGFAGEVGHMPVGDPTARCGCGRRGCWEASIGLHAMLDAVGMPELDTPAASAQAVAERARHDTVVRDTLTRLGHDLGLGIAMLSSVLDPQVVVLGGYFVPLGELVLEPARRTLDARLASDAQVRPELRLSALGTRAAALGAAEQSLGPVLSGDLELAASAWTSGA